MRSHSLFVVGFVFLAGAWLASGGEGRPPDLGRLVAVGDGFLAGFGSGGLVGRGRPGQADAVPAQVARQAGVGLPLPLLERPGLPAQLVVVDGNGNGLVDAGEVRRRGRLRLGSLRTNADARNLAVPGEDSASVFDAVSEGELARALARGADPGVRDALKPILLGARDASAPVSQLTRARASDPSFILVWLGTTDALRLVPLAASPAAPVPAEEFGARMRKLLESLADTGADLAVANVPDPTAFPVLRRAAGDVTACTDEDGRRQAVDANALLSIALDPRLLPSPPCTAVLTPEARERARATVRDYNTEIAAAAAEVAKGRGVRIAVVDVFTMFEDLARQGVAGTGLTTRYLGGVFSLDGIHLTRAGNALVANAFVAAINARFGTAIPSVDVRRRAARELRTRARLASGAEPPFGLLAGDVEGLTAPLPHRLAASLARRLPPADSGPDAAAPGERTFTPAVVGAPASYFMFSGLETGELGEFDDTLNCPIVTAPVCTGLRACQKTTLAQPSQLRSRAMGVAEAFVRTYHLVNVSATPSPTESCAPVTGFDTNVVVPTCSVDVCVQPNGQLRYRLFDRVNGATVGSPTAVMPAGGWRRVEVRVRLRSGINDDECEFRLDGNVVAASVTLNLGTAGLDSGFITNRQAAFPQPPTTGSWLATYDDVAITVGQWPGPGRVIARQGEQGIPTYDQFPPIGAPDVENAWSDTPAFTATRAESPNTGDPVAQTMQLAAFDTGVNPVTPLSRLAVCQTWIHANTSATPDRQYAIRRRIGTVDTDAVIPGINTVFFPFSDGLINGFWVDTLANLNGAQIGARKSGGAGGARMVVNDAWLSCEYEPPAGEPACSTTEICAPAWGTAVTGNISGFANFADGVSCTTGTAPFGYTAQSCAISLGAVPGGNIRCALYNNTPDPNRDALCSSAVTAAVPNAVNTLSLVGCPTLTPNTPYWIVWNTNNNGVQYGVGPQQCGAANGASRYVAATFPTGAAWTPDPWGTTIADTCQIASYLTIAPLTAPTTTTSSTSSTSTSSTSTSSSSSTSNTNPTTTSTSTSSTSSTSTSSTTSTSRTSTSTTSSTSTTVAGLVAAYSFNETGTTTTVLDASGTGNNGTISGATRTTAGRFGGALVFDGVNDSVTVPDAASLDLTAAMTLEAYVFPTVTPNGWRSILSKERPGDLAYFLNASNGNNRPVGGAVLGGVERVLAGPTALPVNAWTHVAVTYNGTALVLYVGGTQVATQNQTGAIAVSANPLRIGGNTPFGEFFQGRLDEVRIYNRALTAGEITNDANQAILP